MVKHVYDDEPIKLTARITGEPKLVAKIKQTDFVVTEIKGDVQTELAPISVDVPSGYPESLATHDYTPAPVDDGIDFYDITYKAKIKLPTGGDRVRDGEPDVHRVWPASVEVIFTSADDKAHKQAKFRVVCKGKESPVKTADESGKWTGATDKAPYTIKAEPPYELVNPSHVGRKRTYEIKRNPYKLEFVSPAVSDTSAPTRQYVNLDRAVEGWTEAKPFGHELELVVGAVGDTEREESARQARQGDLVYIEVNFTPATKRNDPRPRLLDDGLDAPAAESNGGKTWKGQAKLGANGQASFKVELGHAGGDLCEVKIGADASCGDASLKFESWRRLYYELMYPELMIGELAAAGGGSYDVPSAMRAEVVSRLGAVFVEYERTRSHKFLRQQATPGTIVPPRFVFVQGRDRFILGGGLGYAPPIPFSPEDDRTIHVLLADQCYGSDVSIDAQQVFFTQARDHFHTTKYFVPMRISGAVWEAEIANPDAYEADPILQWSAAARPVALGGEYTIKVTELNQNKSVVVTFETDDGNVATTLEGGEEDKLNDFVDDLLKEDELDKHSGTLRLQIAYPQAGEESPPRHQTRHDHVQTLIQDQVGRSAVKIFTHPGLDGWGIARYGDMDDSWFLQQDDRIVTITLPTSNPGETPKPGDFVGAAETATQCRIKLEFSIEGCTKIQGQNSGVRQLLVLKGPPMTAGALASTMCHELGHAMGMTIMAGRSKIPPGTDAANHVDAGGVYYINGTSPFTDGKRDLGIGPHCASGVSGGKLVDPKFESESGTCIMFHSGGNEDNQASFCAVCKDYIKARKLTDLRSNWATRADSDY